METKQIEVTGGIGREKNPETPYFGMDHRQWNCAYDKFEQTIHKLPTLTPEGKVPEDGSYEAELRWQAWSQYQDWFELSKSEVKKLHLYCKTRQIWLISDVVKLQGENENKNQMSSTNEAGKTAEEIYQKVAAMAWNADILANPVAIVLKAMDEYATQQSASKDIEIQKLRAALIEIHDGIYVNDVETVVTIITDALKPTE